MQGELHELQPLQLWFTHSQAKAPHPSKAAAIPAIPR